MQTRISQNNELKNSLQNDPSEEFYQSFSMVVNRLNRYNSRIKEEEDSLNGIIVELENMYFKLANLTFLCDEELRNSSDISSPPVIQDINFDTAAAKRQAYSDAARKMLRISV